MRFLTAEQMRAADRAAVAEANIPDMTLMTNAGISLARAVAEVAALRNTRNVTLVAGHGNNGGDVFVAARCLHENGFRARVITTCEPDAIKRSAREAWENMRDAKVPCLALPASENWDGHLPEPVLHSGIIVDGVLGTGCHGAPSGAAEQAIRWINRMRRGAHALVVSVDLPSGINGDTGETAGEAVHADVTVTFARPKRCFLNAGQAGLVGHLIVADIGIPDEICDWDADESPCLIALPELRQSFTERAWDAHKGSFGHVCVIGGSDGFSHAPVLAALGAVRSGAGLVTLAVPAASAAAAAAWVPEAMVRVIETPQGDLSVDALRGWGRDLDSFDAVVAGPGLSVSERTRGLISDLLAYYNGRLVLDADGLNVLALLYASNEWSPRGDQQLLLTPHPGEAARLLGASTIAVQADRLGAVQDLAETYQATVVLKGAGTLVCEPGGVPRLNRTGNPGMASGGTGDVLAGMVGALWAQGLSASDAAATAVWAHGAAGDFAAFAESRASLSATSLTHRLGIAFQSLERDA